MEPELDGLAMELGADGESEAGEFSAGLEGVGEGEVVGDEMGAREELVVELEGLCWVVGVEVAEHEGGVDEEGRVGEGAEELVGEGEVVGVGEGVELGEAAGEVGVGGLGGFDEGGVDLVGFAEVDGELEEGEVAVLFLLRFLCWRW